jgi:hypothetical protein
VKILELDRRFKLGTSGERGKRGERLATYETETETETETLFSDSVIHEA